MRDTKKIPRKELEAKATRDATAIERIKRAVDENGRPLDWWKKLVRAHTHGGSDEQIEAVARYAKAAEDRGEPCGVWHASHVVLKTPRCLCATCLPEAKRLFGGRAP